jgi:hypothetical protein
VERGEGNYLGVSFKCGSLKRKRFAEQLLSFVQNGGDLAPIVRLSRSVDQLGRNNDTTLFITAFDLELGALSGFGPDNSINHRGRPTPGTGSGEAGRALTRQRVVL